MLIISRRRAPTLPIIAGPLKGSWWAPGAGGKLGRFYLGTYESDQIPLFSDHVGPGDTVIDLGANVGYYTLLASRLVGPGGTVVACEPEPLNAAYLRRHVAANRLHNVTVLEAAVGREEGSVRFTRGRGRGRGHISDHGELQVRIQTLDGLVKQQGIEPTCIKMDVEGAEFDVLRGGTDTLSRHRPSLFLATHGRDVHEASCRLLTEMDYRIMVVDGRELPKARKLLALPA